MLLDLLHQRPLAAGLLLPVCSTVDKTRTEKTCTLGSTGSTLHLLILLGSIGSIVFTAGVQTN